MDIRDLYQELEIIKETKNKRIVLVRSKIDRLLYLKKELPLNNKAIYQQLQQLKNKHIPKIYQLQESDDGIIVIEEYINAISLEEYCLNHDLNRKEVLEIFKQLCLIVANLHQQKPPIIHRDIKPSNIFYLHQKIYLFDFDISRNFKDAKKQDTVLLGSVGYASPEQYGFGQSSQQSDIYALGILLNFLFTKTLPNEKLATGVERTVIEKATNLDPKSRYNSVIEMMQALNIDSKEYLIKKLVVDLPGLKNNSVMKKFLAICGYLILIFSCLTTDLTSNGVLLTGINLWLNRLIILGIVITIILFAGNYMDIRNSCFFSQSKSLVLKIFGIIITVFAWILVEILIFTIISNVLNLS